MYICDIPNWTKQINLTQIWWNFQKTPNGCGEHRCSHLLPINIAGCYGNHCGLPYETGQEGSNPKRGPMNPETQKYTVFK